MLALWALESHGLEQPNVYGLGHRENDNQVGRAKGIRFVASGA